MEMTIPMTRKTFNVSIFPPPSSGAG